jgi:hypothetical protein
MSLVKISQLPPAGPLTGTEVVPGVQAGQTVGIPVTDLAPVGASFVVVGLDGTLTNERRLAGTLHQVILTDNGPGSTLVLSLPQDLDVTSIVTFDGLTLTTTPLAATSGGTGRKVYAVGDLLYADTTTTLARLADVAAGKLLRSGGVGAAPAWSASTFPEVSAVGDLIYGSAANTWSVLADVAAGSYLRSGGVGAAPLWSTITLPNAAAQGDIWYASATSTITALPKDTNATRYLSNTGATNNPLWAQVNLANGVTGRLPYANITQGSALSVLGVTGNAGADVASIVAASDGDVLRRSGAAVGFGTIVLNAVNFANPSASLGLAAINGSAVTAMRSDAAPALSQSIAPTWTGAHTFANSGGQGFTISRTAAPNFRINETAAAADNRLWDFVASSEQMLFRAVNDAASTANSYMTVDRTGAVVDSVTFPGNHVIILSNGAAQPDLVLSRSDQGADGKRWSFRVGSTGALAISTQTDAGVDTNNAILVNRSGTTVSNVQFPSAGTTASAANAFLDNAAGNTLLRSTSSLRYKADIQDLELDEVTALLALRPVTYRSKCDADDPSLRWYGLIAEEVASILPRMVHYSVGADGDMRPDGVQYDRLTVLIIKALQNMHGRIARLERPW